jgi:tetratricopeptide (TPR) repeat protein
MGRPERDLDVSHPLHAFAAELRELRRRAGSPKYLSMSRKSGVSRTALSEAAGGDHLPTWRTVDAYVVACGGRPLDWLPRWERLSDGKEAAGGQAASSEAAAATTRCLPRDIAAFTGRDEPLRRLLTTAAETARQGRTVGIGAIDGMAGVGKTAFAIHAGHRLAAEFPDGQLFLDLHAHTAGQRPVTPSDALRSLLLTTGVPAQLIPTDLPARAAMWRDRLSGRRVLLVLDDAAGHEQVRPLLPGTPGSLVLITSRRRLAALEEVEPLTLGTLSPGQAGELFVRLIGGACANAEPTAVTDLMKLCGGLPLAVGLLAGRLRSHPSWSVRHLTDTLEHAKDRLAVMRAENIAVGAAFDLSYRELPPAQQRLFRRLGLHPGGEIDARAAAALDGIDLATAQVLLDALYDDHLIDEPRPGRYRLHDLIRDYVRSLASTGDEAAVDRLLHHYLHATSMANQRITGGGDSAGGESAPVDGMPDLASRPAALGWFETERANLQACLDHAAANARHGYAVRLGHALHAFLRVAGHWDQALAVHQKGLDAARRAGDQAGEAAALEDLGTMQHVTGRYSAAQASLAEALALFRELGERRGQAGTLSNLGTVRCLLGEYSAATDALTGALRLYRELDDRRGQANALTELGVVQYLVDEYQAASTSLTDALTLFGELGSAQGEANALNALGSVQYLVGDYAGASASLTGALARYRDLGDRLGVADTMCELGRVRELAGDASGAMVFLAGALADFRAMGSHAGRAIALIRLGVVQCQIGEHGLASASLTEALDLYRELGLRLGQANALSRLGGVHCLAGEVGNGRTSLLEALALYREIGDRLGQAYTLNILGAHRRDASDDSEAVACHVEALRLAREVSSPLEEARALEGIGRHRLGALDHEAAHACLREALAIYQHLGAPEGAQIVATLEPPDPGRHPVASASPTAGRGARGRAEQLHLARKTAAGR